jgi:hypothetical protein
MTKLCKKCKQIKNLIEFNPNKLLTDGLENRCRTCRNKQQNHAYSLNVEHKRQQMREWRENHPEQARTNNHKSVRRLKEKCYTIRRDTLISNPCLICKEYRIHCLDFHHLDPSQKVRPVSYCRSIKSVCDEIQKCIVLCANCHRLFHAKEIKLPPNTKPLSIDNGRYLET